MRASVRVRNDLPDQPEGVQLNQRAAQIKQILFFDYGISAPADLAARVHQCLK
jgi:hypothetical protein